MNQKKKQVQNKTNEELEEDKLDLLDKCNQIFAKIRQDFNMKFPTDQYIKFDRQYANHMKKEFDLFALCIEEVYQTYEIDGEKILSSFLNNVLITMKVMLFTQLRCFLNYLDQTIQHNDARSLKNWESSEISKLSRHKVKVTRGTVDEDVIKAQEQNLVNDPSDEIKKRLGVSLDPLLREYSMSKQELIETLEEKRRNLTLKESKAGRYLFRQIEGIKQVVTKEKAFVTEFEDKHLLAIKKLVFSDGVTQVQGILDQITENLDHNAKKKLMKVLEYLFSNAKDIFAKKNVSCQTQIIGQTIDGYESQITKLNKGAYEADRHIEQVLKETLQKDQKITELEKQITLLKRAQAKEQRSEDPTVLLMQTIDEQNRQIEKLNNQVVNLNVDKQSLNTQILIAKRELEIVQQNSTQQTQEDVSTNGKKGNVGKGKNTKKGATSSTNNKNNKNSTGNPSLKNIQSKNDFNDYENENNNYEIEEEGGVNIRSQISQQLVTSNTIIQSPTQGGQLNPYGGIPTTVNSPTGFTQGVKLSTNVSNVSRESFSKKDSEQILGLNKNINTPTSNLNYEKQTYSGSGGQSEIKSTQFTDGGSPQQNNQSMQNNVKIPQSSQFNNQVQNTNLTKNQQNDQIYSSNTLQSKQGQQSISSVGGSNTQSIQQNIQTTSLVSTNISNPVNKQVEGQETGSVVSSANQTKEKSSTKGGESKSKKVSIHQSSNNKVETSNTQQDGVVGKHSKNNSSINLNVIQEDKQANPSRKVSTKDNKHNQIKGNKKVSTTNSLHNQSEQSQDIVSLAQVSNQQSEVRLLDGNANSNLLATNNNSSKNNLSSHSAQQLGSLQDISKSNTKSSSNNKQTSTSQIPSQNVIPGQSNEFSSTSQQNYTKQLADQMTQVPSTTQLKSEKDISSQTYLESAQAQNQNSVQYKPNNQIRGSNFTGTQNSLIQTKDTDLTSYNTIPQSIIQGLEGQEDNQERTRSKLDLNDILDALDLNQEEEEKKQSAKILQVLTNKENPKRREIINSIVQVLNQNGQLKTPRSDEGKEVEFQKYNQKINTYTGFTSSDQGQTQYKKTQNSINSTPYSTQQNMRYHNNSEHKNNETYYKNQQKSLKFIDSDNGQDKKYYKQDISSQISSAKELDFKNRTLEKIDQNLNESSLNTSMQGKHYSGSQSQHDLSQLQKQSKKYATQVSFKDLQVKPVDQEHLQKIMEKQEVMQDIIRKKNQIAMSRFQGNDSNLTSYRDSSQNQEINLNSNKIKRNLSNLDQKRGQFTNQWRVKDEFRIHDPKSMLQYMPNHTTSQSTHNVGYDQPRKNVPKFIPGAQSQIKKSQPFNEEQQFTQELFNHFQQGKIDFSKLKELDLTSKQVRSQTNLNTQESTVSGMNTKYHTTVKTDNNIGFNEFHDYYAELISQHRKCGPMCIHLKRFYEKLDFNYKQYEKRQFIYCPTLVVQEIPKESKRDPTKFNLQTQTMYPASTSKI